MVKEAGHRAGVGAKHHVHDTVHLGGGRVHQNVRLDLDEWYLAIGQKAFVSTMEDCRYKLVVFIINQGVG